MAENLEFRISGNTNDAVDALVDLQKEAKRTGNVVGSAVSKGVDNAQKSLSKLPKASNQATQSLINLGRVAQDAPFGIIGIANNLNPLFESLQRTSQAAGGFTGTLKALGGALVGGGGLGFALSLVTGALSFFALRKRKATEETKALKTETDIAAEKQREFESAISKASAAVIKQAGDLSDLKTVLSETTAASNDLTQATINRGVAQFIFDQKNVKVQELLNAEIERQIKLRKQNNIAANVPEFNLQSISKDPITRRIGNLKADIGQLDALASGLEETLRSIFNNTFKSASTVTASVPNQLSKLITDSLTVPAESLTRNLSASLSTVLERTATTADFGEAARIVNLQLFNALDKEFKALGFEIPDINLKASPADNENFLKGRLEQMKALKEEAQELSGVLANVFTSFAEAAIEGKSAFEVFGNTIKTVLLQVIQQFIQAQLQALIFNLLIGGLTGGTGITASRVGRFNFSGNRAEGGTVNEGQAYRVGERGPEWFVPQVSGSIIPTSQKTAIPRMSGKSTSFSTQRFKIRGKDILLSSSRTGASQSRLGVA